MARNHILLAGLVVSLSWVPVPAAAQVCLGRSLPGQGSVAVDMAASRSTMARVSIGGYGGSGFGLRIGVVGMGAGDPWSDRGIQLEALVAVPVGDSLELCPGLSVVRPLPNSDMVRLAELFTSFGLRTQAGRSTWITFLTPVSPSGSGVISRSHT